MARAVRKKNYRGKRVRLATGIYSDRYGVTVRAKARGDVKEIRYPLGTPLDTLRKARRDLRDELRVEPQARHGTLAQDFAAYLQTFPNGPRRRDESALLDHWRDVGLATRNRDEITALEIRQQLALWSARFKPATLNHLRRVLGAVYSAVNGRSGVNPVRDVPKATVRYEEPRAIPYPIIELIFANIPDIGRGEKGTAKKDGGPGRSTINKTKLRLRVMAYTGLPPAQLGRVQSRDLNLRAKTVYARPRRKGAGVDGYTLPLIDQAVEAFRAFDRAQCYGAFSSRSAAKTWRLAVNKAKQQWRRERPREPWPVPADVRAYDLRHSFASAVMMLTGDLQAVADLLMHTSLSTTRRYTKGAVNPRMQHARDRLNQAFAGGRKGGTTRKLRRSTVG